MDSSCQCLEIAPPKGQGQAAPLIELLSKAGYTLRFDCGGLGVCGKCLVRISSREAASPPSPAEFKNLGPEKLGQGWRLACQVKVIKPLTVQIPRQTLTTREACGKTDLPDSYQTNPLVKRILLEPTPLTAQAGSLWEAQGINRADQREKQLANLGAARQLAGSLRPGENTTLVTHQKKGIVAAHKGKQPQSLGLALDLGTTTLAAYLLDFDTGKLLAASNSANPQASMGQDVISRIAYTRKHKKGLELLSRLVRDEINNLAKACLLKAKLDPGNIDEVLAVGNSTMQQIFCGLDPYGLGQAPYLPFTQKPQDFCAHEVGLNLSPGINVHIFPVVSGFIGGDTLAAAIACDLDKQKETTLLVDIGTNGELVLCRQGRLWAASCATGPTLEGAHLSCGMRAVKGAIHRFSLDPSTLIPRYQVIGGESGALPSGICGSGVIDVVAALLKAGVVKQNGRLDESKPKVEIDEKGIGQSFTLVRSEDSGTGRDICLTLKDLRQIQLSKAALAAGIKLLLSRAGISQVSRLILTGAFGAHFDWQSARAIGMIPCQAGKIEAMVNAAGSGAAQALLDQDKRREAALLANKIEVLNLAGDPDFQLTFAEEIGFPPS
ncbi:ASKHA domain-containing protein [Dethiosulfatarculus sandiegensis]|uniref:2Fe-2S ferredoxin-type domain-containing protein n=1 Tax=Dethiosulfatarculus sandiegensis TaxID=1429043 RepID=A0A0D2JP32_9BACT|nr:ASKHA domain-containing protein [Dethiosulfatarculus sandiegensis]KIX11250.1 hypothetical protein X474_25935 [Dethiosulfatarculus sandiegensis]